MNWHPALSLTRSQLMWSGSWTSSACSGRLTVITVAPTWQVGHNDPAPAHPAGQDHLAVTEPSAKRSDGRSLPVYRTSSAGGGIIWRFAWLLKF